MKTVLAAGSFLTFVAFIPSLSDATARPSPTKPCKALHIYDPLQIRKCMRNYLDLCAIGEKSEQVLTNSSAKFGTCLGQSIYSLIFNSSFSLPTRPEVCKNRLTANLLNSNDIGKCSSQLEVICKKWNDADGVKNLLLILPGAKCILEKQPKYADPKLWKQVTCSALAVFRNETMPPLLKVLNFVDKLIGCVRPPPAPAC
ncbi:uncharacterized protein LOC144137964 [Haemaphysalis longicornis]